MSFKLDILTLKVDIFSSQLNISQRIYKQMDGQTDVMPDNNNILSQIKTDQFESEIKDVTVVGR